MWKKFLFALFAAVILLFVILIAGVIAAYIKPAAPEFPQTAELSPSGEIAPGAENHYSFEVTLPANTVVRSAELFRNGTPLSMGKAEFISWHFNKTKWKISGSFRIFEIGKTDGLSVTVSQEKFAGENPPAFEVKLPETECAVPKDVASGAKLLLADLPKADELDGVEKSSAEPFYKNWIFYAVIAVIILLCVLAAIFFKRGKRQIPLPLDQRTLREIQHICSMVKAKKMRAETGFASLSDIMRNYFEEFSGLPATRRTTAEFLHELAVNPDLLSAEERIYLTGFLNNADMIKFAGATSQPEMLDKAAAEAGSLVRSTTAAALKKENESK